MFRINRTRAVAGVVMAGAGLLAFVPTASASTRTSSTVTTKNIVHTFTAAGSDVTYNVQLALDALYQDSPGCTLTAIPPVSGSVVGDGTTINACSPEQPGKKSDPPGTPPVKTEDYSHDITAEFYPQGSAAGLYEMCNQGATGVPKLSFARASGAASSSNCAGLTNVEYATDGLAPVTFPGDVTNAINAYNAANPSAPFFFTKAVLADLFSTCTINGSPLTTWSQLDSLGPTFPADPIAFWSVSTAYGLESAWSKGIGVSSSTGDACAQAQSASHVITPNNAAPIEASSNSQDAIYFYSIGVANVTGGQTSVLQPVGTTSAVAPTIPNVANASWPIIHGLFDIYQTNTTSGNLLRYIGPNGWLCTGTGGHALDPLSGTNYATEIANTISANGFVPIPPVNDNVCITSVS